MIFFCEDCGGKNDLPPWISQNGKVMFQCRACGYNNSYAAPSPVLSIEKQMEQLSEKIRSFPEIMGLFFYDSTLGVLENRVPVLTPKDLLTLGRTFSRQYLEGLAVYSDLEGMLFVISDKHFAVFRLADSLFLILICRTVFLPDEVKTLVNRAGDWGFWEQ